MASAPHSAPYLSDLRDLWWNADFLDLVARRLALASVDSLLDVGCGLGHWSRLWHPRLAPDASLVGVDREPRWLRGASERHPAPRARFLHADAVALPFADASFDAVTCQTVLMHLAAPERALAEMVRVVKPGGLVFCAEPNNVLAFVRLGDSWIDRPVEEIAQVVSFWLYYRLGKMALREGDAAVGERLPALFAAAGLEGIEVCQSDRAQPILPPYGPEERAVLDFLVDMRAAGTGIWDRAELRARVLAGGADEAFFEAAFRVLVAWAEIDEALIRVGRYTSVGGGLHFLASGRKPG